MAIGSTFSAYNRLRRGWGRSAFSVFNSVRFVMIGDSISDFVRSSASAQNSYAFALEKISNYAAVNIAEYATNGYTSGQILATHIPQAVAAADTYDVAIILAGINDRPFTDPSATIANIAAMVQALRAVGKCVVLCQMTGGSYSLTDAGRIAGWNTVNAAIAAMATPYVKVVDLATTLGVGATQPYYYVNTETTDQLHPNGLGAMVMGGLIWDTLKSWSTQAPGGELATGAEKNTYSSMAGTSGTVSTGASGTMATGYTITRVSGTGTAACSGNRVTITGSTYSGTALPNNSYPANVDTVFRVLPTSHLAGFAQNDVVEVVLELEVMSGTGDGLVFITGFQFNSGDGFLGGLTPTNNASVYICVSPRMIGRTIKTVGRITLTNASVEKIHVGPAIYGNCDLKITRISVKKV